MKKVSDIKKQWLIDNIETLIKKGRSKADISRELGVKPQFLNSLINGPRGITDQFVDKFIITFRLTQPALLDQDTVLSEPPPEYDKSFLKAQERLVSAQEETIEIQKRYIASLEKEIAKLLKEKKPVEDGQKRKAG
jgi:hypothetical protein